MDLKLVSCVSCVVCDAYHKIDSETFFSIRGTICIGNPSNEKKLPVLQKSNDKEGVIHTVCRDFICIEALFSIPTSKAETKVTSAYFDDSEEDKDLIKGMMKIEMSKKEDDENRDVEERK